MNELDDATKDMLFEYHLAQAQWSHCIVAKDNLSGIYWSGFIKAIVKAIVIHTRLPIDEVLKQESKEIGDE